MHTALKLLAGIAASIVLARGATQHRGQAMMAQLGSAAAAAMRDHGVTDGSVSFRQPSHRVTRVARLSGSADTATRAAVIAQVKRHPGIADAIWVAR
jgi:pyruvoyl-dependent arginine decarboxylase (PvlArgDC)